MATKSKSTPTDAPTDAPTGAPTDAGTTAPPASEAASAQASEIRATYERARDELGNAITRLRTEVEQLDVAQARAGAENWVKDNPTLATLLALGGGLLLGKLIGSAFRPAPPPPLPVRLRRQAMGIVSHAGEMAEEAGEALLKGAVAAGGAAALAGAGLADKATELGHLAARRAQVLGDEVAGRASDLSGIAAERARHAADVLGDQAGDLSSTARRRAHEGFDAAESALTAARSIVAAVLVKKVSDWIRRVS